VGKWFGCDIVGAHTTQTHNPYGERRYRGGTKVPNGLVNLDKTVGRGFRRG
jgi:hypothetical protein